MASSDNQEMEQSSAGVRVVLLNLPEDEGEGLGFKLTRTLWDPYPWIRDVTPESRAASAGLRTGDCLLQADGNDLLGLPINKVAGIIRGDGQGREVTLVLWSCGVNPDEDPELLWSGGGAGSDRPRRALGGVLRSLACAVCGATAAAALSCRRTHLYCEGCWSRLERCALCREVLPPKDSPYSRNLVAQQVFEAIAKEYDIKLGKTQIISRSPKISPTTSRRGQYQFSMMNKNRFGGEKYSSDPNINRTPKNTALTSSNGNSETKCHIDTSKVTMKCSCSCQNLLHHTLMTRLRETSSLADLKCSVHNSLSKSLNNISLDGQSSTEPQQSSSMENLKKTDMPVFLLAPPPIYFLVSEHTK
ncbi:unnamed protein product [Danaus chrysippus]|uniref:(African queen) hypothetical protein n=1 Tax=Danaus chrysippus TaxID=151541 RepID=A0A8J2W8C9_9NEOP|nr:unnamed protein product [Danaus chrysippus]